MMASHSWEDLCTLCCYWFTHDYLPFGIESNCKQSYTKCDLCSFINGQFNLQAMFSGYTISCFYMLMEDVGHAIKLH